MSDACELNEVPCVSTVVPWQPWFFGRKGDPKKGFNWTYHFFWGLEDVIAVYTGMWQSAADQHSVGGLLSQRRRRQRLGRREARLSAGAGAEGLHADGPRPLPDAARRTSPRRSRLQAVGAQIVTGVVIPPDAKNFLDAGASAGFQARRSSRSARRCCFRPSIEALGRSRRRPVAPRCGGRLRIPFKSSLTGQSARRARRGLREGAPRSSGPSRSVSRTRCSKSPPTSLKRAKDVDSNEADPRRGGLDQAGYDRRPRRVGRAAR